MNRAKYIRIFTLSFGGKYEYNYQNYAIPSVMPDVERLRKEGYKVDFIKYTEANTSKFLIKEAEEGARLNCISIMLPPDTIFGNGTLYNLIRMGDKKPHSIAVPHFRIGDAVLEKIKLPMSNREMARLIMDMGHLDNLMDEKVPNQCHHGITVRKITETNWDVVHNLPTIYYAKFTANDATLFRSYPNALIQWDRGFLRRLYDENRLKVVGSSELAFCLEWSPGVNYIDNLKENHFEDKYTAQKTDIHNQALNCIYFSLEG